MRATKERRLATWKLPVSSSEASRDLKNLPGEALFLDCARGCSALSREASAFRVVE